MTITGLSHLVKWENLHNWWLTKYFFSPLYITNWNKNEITDLSRLGQDSDAFIASQARHQHNEDLLHGALENEEVAYLEVAYLYLRLLDFNKLHD